MGFDYAGIYYQNPDCASMSMGIGFSGDGKIQITHTVHNKTSGTPSQSSGGKYISKNKVNLKGYTNLQVIGYCTAQETGIQNGFYFNIYDQDTNTLLIETLMPTGSNGTVNINIAGIQREVYFGGVIWKYNGVFGVEKKYCMRCGGYAIIPVWENQRAKGGLPSISEGLPSRRKKGGRCQCMLHIRI